MYIKKYWGNFIGGSDDSLNLVAFLEDQKKEEMPLSEIFAKIGLDKQNWNFRQTVGYLEFTHSNGVEMDFHFAIDVVTEDVYKRQLPDNTLQKDALIEKFEQLRDF